MINWIRKRLGYHVCEEFTKWRTIEGLYGRAPTDPYEFMTSLNDPECKIHFRRRWQERACTMCGKVQERELTR